MPVRDEDDVAVAAALVDLIGGVEHRRQGRVVAQRDGAGDHPGAFGQPEFAADLGARRAHGEVDVDVRVDEFGAFDDGDTAAVVVDDGFSRAEHCRGSAADDLGSGLLDDVRGVEGFDGGDDLRVQAGGQTGEGQTGEGRRMQSVCVDDVHVLVVLVKSEGGVRVGHREASACREFDLTEFAGQFLGDSEGAQQ